MDVDPEILARGDQGRVLRGKIDLTEREMKE